MSMRNWSRTAAIVTIAAGLLTPASKAQILKDAVAESAVPAEVSTALRDRVTQFFQYHVGGVNRRAIDLVAEDTKDYYFASQKLNFKSFQIDKAEFNKDQTRAVVTLHAARPWEIQGQSLVVDGEMTTTWKLEEGKWVWYVDEISAGGTPMGVSDLTAAEKVGKPDQLFEVNADGTFKLPDDFNTPERLMAQSQKILSQAGLDKDELVLNYGEAKTQELTFTNTSTGEVMLEMAGAPPVPGLKISLDKRAVKAQGQAKILVDYQPPTGKDVEPWSGQPSYTVNLVLEPFSRLFPIRIRVNPGQPQ